MITTNIRDFSTPLTELVTEIINFLNFRTKYTDTKPNLNNDLSDTICDKGSVAENESLKVKLEEVDKENAFLPGEVKDRSTPPC